MRRPRDLIRRLALLTSTAGLAVAAATLGSSGPALARQDLFTAMGVQRPANPRPAPDLALPSPDGRMVGLKDFKGKVVLLGFFTST